MANLHLLTFTILLIVGTACNKHTTPSAFDPPDFNFGIIKQNTILTAKTKFINKSKESIKIFPLRKSCTCTSATIDKFSLSPGESADVTCKIDTTGKEGQLESSVFLGWNSVSSSLNGIAKLALKAEIQTVATLTLVTQYPIKVDKRNGPFLLVWSLKRGKSEEVWDKVIAQTNIGNVQVERKNNNEYELSLPIDPTKYPVGRIKDSLNVRLFNGNKILNTVFDLPFSVGIEGILNPSPSALFFKSVPFNEPLKGTFSITSKVKNIEFLSISSSSERELMATLVGRHENIWTFQYNGKMSGRLSGTLHIHFRMASTNFRETVIIPWIGYPK